MEHKMMQVFATLMVFLALSFQPVLSQADISRTGCGTTKQCVESPTDCNPADNTTTCLFGSARPTALSPPNGIDLAFELSGNSSGYIAVGLTKNESQNIMLFVCGQNSTNNGTFFSLSTIYNITNKNMSNTLAKAMTNIKNIVNGENIKCTFNVAGLNATTGVLRAADTTFQMVIGSGPLDGNGLGAFTLVKTGDAKDLSTFFNSTNTAGSIRPFYSNAALPLVSFLTLSILTFA